MKNKSSGQSSTAGTPVTSTTQIPAEKAANVNPESPFEFDAETIASAELLVEQGAVLEVDLVKHIVSSAAVMCGQGYLFGKAKKFLRAKTTTDNVVDGVINGLYAKFQLGPKAMNRRIQIWDKAVELGIIHEELRHKIETAATFTQELLKEMEGRIGTITGTQFMRELGILPAIEDKPKVAKAQSVKEKIDSTLESMIEQLENLVYGKVFRKEVDDETILEGYRSQLHQLKQAARKFKSIAAASAVTDQGSAPTIESSEVAKLKKENIDLKKHLIDAEEGTRALSEA